jgi:hypothetical protein
MNVKQISMFVIDMNIYELKDPKNINQFVSIYFKSLITISSNLRMVKFRTFHTQRNDTFGKNVKSQGILI